MHKKARQFRALVLLGVYPQQLAGWSHPRPIAQIYTHFVDEELEDTLKSFRQATAVAGRV